LFYSLREALSQGNTVKGNSDFKYLSKNFDTRNYSNNFNESNHISESATAYSASPYQNLVNADELHKPLGVAVAKVKKNYLMAQNEQGLLVVQLKQARELIAQQQIETSLKENAKLISKPVLIPFNLNLNTANLNTSNKNIDAQSWLDKNNNKLQQLGFEFAVLGENEIMVRQVPAMLNATDIKQSIKQFIDTTINDGIDFSTALIDMIVNDDFSNSPTDWNGLLRDLESNESHKNCYHQIAEKDLAGWFK